MPEVVSIWPVKVVWYVMWLRLFLWGTRNSLINLSRHYLLVVSLALLAFPFHCSIRPEPPCWVPVSGCPHPPLPSDLAHWSPAAWQLVACPPGLPATPRSDKVSMQPWERGDTPLMTPALRGTQCWMWSMAAAYWLGLSLPHVLTKATFTVNACCSSQQVQLDSFLWSTQNLQGWEVITLRQSPNSREKQ